MDSQGQAKAEVFESACTPLPVVRSLACRLQEISDLPNLLSGTRSQGNDPRREESQLVGRRFEGWPVVLWASLLIQVTIGKKS